MTSIFKQSLSLPRLPPELTDMVIDNLEWDLESLRKTCLVCRSWLPRSRVLLFKRLTVSIPHRKGFDAAVTFLTKRPHIARHVLSLQLKGPPILYDDDTPLAAQQQPPCIPASTLATLLAVLTRLRGLHLTDISFWSYNLRPTKLQSTSRFKLDVLTMNGVGSMRDTTDHVMRILGLFSEIKSLTLGSVVQRLDARTRLPEGLKIHALHVEDVPSNAYFEAAREMQLRGSLTSLTAQIYCLEDVTSFAGLIEDTAPELLSLGVDTVRLFTVPDYAEDVEPWRTDPDEALRDVAPALSLCKKLEWLTIMVPYEGYAEEQSYSFDAWRFLMGVLASVPPSVLHLNIIFVSNNGASLNTIDYDWAQLHARLQAYVTHDDKHFRLVCTGLDSDEEDTAFAILNDFGPILP